MAISIDSLSSGMGCIQSLSWVNVGLGAANLCTSTVGFAIMNYKLDQMSNNLGKMSQQVHKLIDKAGIDTINDFERLRSRYSEILDAQRRKSTVSENHYHDLVVDMYHDLKLLYRYFMENIVTNTSELLEAIFTLAAMFEHTICLYDAVYYFNHKDAIHNLEKRHCDHDLWISLFISLSSEEFIDRLVDFCFIDLEKSQRETYEITSRIYLSQICHRVRIEDTLQLISECNNVDEYNQLCLEIDKKAFNKIKDQILLLEESEQAKPLALLEYAKKELI